jgi:hypothetical protein
MSIFSDPASVFEKPDVFTLLQNAVTEGGWSWEVNIARSHSSGEALITDSFTKVFHFLHIHLRKELIRSRSIAFIEASEERRRKNAFDFESGAEIVKRDELSRGANASSFRSAVPGTSRGFRRISISP